MKLQRFPLDGYTFIYSRDFLPFVMKHYGESLQYGDKFIYQSVPKILQFWLDFGANVTEQGSVKSK